MENKAIRGSQNETACRQIVGWVIPYEVNMYLVGQHFSLPGYTFHQINGLAVEQVKSKDPFILKAREA